MFAFTFGELALAQRPLEYTDHYPSRNTLYMRAQDGHAYVTSLLFSVFEGIYGFRLFMVHWKRQVQPS
ncbi:unnamed protein product, partial [Vitis vinifera]